MSYIICKNVVYHDMRKSNFSIVFSLDKTVSRAGLHAMRDVCMRYIYGCEGNMTFVDRSTIKP